MGPTAESTSGLRTWTRAVVLITGGASGIGAALARALAERGAIILIADRHEEGARDLARSLGGQVEAATVDVRDAAAVEAWVAAAFARHGRVDYFFNNAGTGVGGEALDVTLEDWRYVVEVNLMGVIHGIHAIYPRMVRQGFGHIVNTASMAGLMAAPLTSSYCATKHAVVGLSRTLRAEGRLYGVRVSVFCPGAIDTPILVNAGRYGRITRPIPEAAQRAVWARLRPMRPDRFAERVLGAVAANRSIIIEPIWWRALFWLNRLSPAAADWVMFRGFVSTRRELQAASEKQQ